MNPGRTQTGTDEEKYALKALRGEGQTIEPMLGRRGFGALAPG